MAISPDNLPDTDEPTDETSRTRRNALRALIAGGGAAAGVAAFGKTASAADDEELLLGDSALAEARNTSQSPTTLVYDGPAYGDDGLSVLGVGDAIPVPEGPGVPPSPRRFPAFIGGYGNELVVNGLLGSAATSLGYGVVAVNLAGEAATDTDPVPIALFVNAGSGAQVRFEPGEQSGPSAGQHTPGELYVDADYTLWYSIEGEEPDTVDWVSLSAAASGAGAFHAIDPQRAYDSRQAGFSPDGGEMLAPNTNRVISVANGHDGGGSVILEDAVPEGATAVQINLTAANPTAENFLAVTSGDSEVTQTSVLNWGADELQIANSITVPINADREIRVYCGDQTGSTHFLVDVFGYYL